MSRIGLIPVMSFKDPAIADDDDLGLEQWVAQTAVPIPTLKSDLSGSSPKLSVEMKVLSATGHSRKDAIDRLRRDLSYKAEQVPELQLDEIEVS